MTTSFHDTRRDRGFSLVELMVAITIGLLMLAGLTTLFYRNSQTRDEIERSNRQLENGRYAIQLISDDLRLAGFYGEYNPADMTAPGTMPDPCATAAADLISAMPVHIQGVDNAASIPSCLSDVASGTDIIVVRHASTCALGESGCDAEVSGIPYFQASFCDSVTELRSTSTLDHFALDTNTSNLTKHARNCTTVAAKRRFRVHIYFIANNGNSGDGIKTLKRAELGAGAFSIVPLVEGIENLQLEYGLDTNADGTPDVFTAAPGSYGSCSGTACITNWQNVMAVKLHLLARNTTATPNYTDTKTYSLGLNAAGTANTAGPFNDAYKRHVYDMLVRLPNPIGRRQ